MNDNLKMDNTIAGHISLKTHTITNMNDNLKMDNTIAGHNKDGQYNSRSYFTKRTHTITNMNDNLKMDNTIAGHISLKEHTQSQT